MGFFLTFQPPQSSMAIQMKTLFMCLIEYRLLFLKLQVPGANLLDNFPQKTIVLIEPLVLQYNNEWRLSTTIVVRMIFHNIIYQR